MPTKTIVRGIDVPVNRVLERVANISSGPEAIQRIVIADSATEQRTGVTPRDAGGKRGLGALSDARACELRPTLETPLNRKPIDGDRHSVKADCER